MAYHINELKVTDFISDSTIKLPRFQRRKAWNEKQYFELLVSMFKGYPMGVVIYNQMKVRNQDVNYLLDGRQRRTALKTLIENPLKLYLAAIKFLGVKITDPVANIDDKFWEKVGRCLNQSDNQNEQEELEEAECDLDPETQKGNVKLLLDFLKQLHGSHTKSFTALEKRWDFNKYFNYLPYIGNQDRKVDPKKLRVFLIKDMVEAFPDVASLTAAAFFEFVTNNYSIKDEKVDEFRVVLANKIDDLKKDYEIVKRVQESVISQAQLGLIKIIHVTSIDSQNIFSLVNRGGTQLKAEELLSAKAYWNTEVLGSELSVEERNHIAELYHELEIPGEDQQHTGTYVYWDLCATFMDRVDEHKLVFQRYDKTENGLLQKIQHGFKTVAAMLKDGISAVKIEEIEKDSRINLVAETHTITLQINGIITELLGNEFFRRLQRWGRPISSLVGLSPALEFLAVLRKKWVELNCENGANRPQFMQHAKCLFDRLIFEHASGLWKGSSDSKLYKHLTGDLSLRTSPTPDAEWRTYFEKAFAPTDEDYAKHVGVLYYFAVLDGKEPDNVAEIDYDIDHIIPQKAFDNLPAGSPVVIGLKNCLGNVSLLPRKKNESKNGKKLNELPDDLRALVEKYSGVPRRNFEKYSNVVNISDLVTERKPIYLDVLRRRDNVLFG